MVVEDRVGTSPRCTVCGLTKAPIGRSVPMGVIMCDRDCSAYHDAPLPDTLWPGELQSEFGYGCILAPDHTGKCQITEPPMSKEG